MVNFGDLSDSDSVLTSDKEAWANRPEVRHSARLTVCELSDDVSAVKRVLLALGLINEEKEDAT